MNTDGELVWKFISEEFYSSRNKENELMRMDEYNDTKSPYELAPDR